MNDIASILKKKLRMMSLFLNRFINYSIKFIFSFFFNFKEVKVNREWKIEENVDEKLSQMPLLQLTTSKGKKLLKYFFSYKQQIC